MRVMKNKTLFESFQENLKEIDANVKHLNESQIVWSSEISDDYTDWTDEDFIREYEGATGEKPESVEQAQDYFLNDTDDALWDMKVESLEELVPSIQNQTTDDIIIMSGTVGLWTGNHAGGKVIQLQRANDLFIGDDTEIVRLLNEDGNLVWEGIHHDGAHYMGLYGLPKDENARINLVKELGLVDWYLDLYSYDNENDAVSDALALLTSAKDLNEALNPDDFGTLAKLCPPIKVNQLNESVKIEILDESFNLDDELAYVTDVAESIYKGSEINANTIERLLYSHESLKDKYTEYQKNKIVKWFEDQELMFMPKEDETLGEQDSLVRVVTSQQEDRNYSITDITELNKVSDGDVQPPIDISGLLVEVDSRLTESYGEKWGQINFQSTRYNSDTKDSNALFELCVGKDTYLMSMLLEENCSVLKVNNTKGQTIFKRKSNDIVGLAESYIKQFIPKEADDVPNIIKHINEDLHDVYNFLLSQIEISKDVPKEEKDAFTSYLRNQIYAFVAEVSNTVNADTPNEEGTLELPSFDKMVEDIFGKEWVKEEPKEEKLELEGTETLKEDNVSDSVFTSFRPSGQKDGLLGTLWFNVNGKAEKIDLMLVDGEYKLVYGIMVPDYIKEFVDSTGGYEKFVQDAVNYVNKNKSSKLKESYEVWQKYYDEDGSAATPEFVQSFESYEDAERFAEGLNEDPNCEAYVTERESSLKESAQFYYKEFSGAGEIDYVEFETEQEACDYAEKVNKDTGHETAVYRIDNDECISLYDAINEADELEGEVPEVEEPKTEEPKNGLGTGYASFTRKPKNLQMVEDKSNYFTEGEASYLICEKQKLTEDEFNRLTDDFLSPNEYCKSFEPLDTDNYSYNCIEFSCDGIDYTLLVDPSGYDYCRYVAKVGGNE